MSSSASSSVAKLRYLRDFLFVAKKLRGGGGGGGTTGGEQSFSTVLGVDPATILRGIQPARSAEDDDDERRHSHLLSFDDDDSSPWDMRLRYRVPGHLCRRGRRTTTTSNTSSSSSSPPPLFPLSAYLSLFDEVSTYAIVADEASGRRPGVSISLYAEFGPAGMAVPAEAARGRRAGDSVDVKVRVDKIGKNLAFATVHAVDVPSGDLVCTGRHTKFLVSDTVQDLALSDVVIPLTVKYAELQSESKSTSTSSASSSSDGGGGTGENPGDAFTPPSLDALLALDCSSTEDDGDGRASFRVRRVHENLMGSLHGGCQAMVMEEFGRGVAEADLGTEDVELLSMNVSYLSAGRGTVHLDAETAHATPSERSSVAVRMTSCGPSSGSSSSSSSSPIISEGILHWVKAADYGPGADEGCPRSKI